MEQLACRVIFFFKLANAVFGDYLLNPHIPTKALQLNFIGINTDYVRSYMRKHSGVAIAFRNEDSTISYSDFGHRSMVFVFNLAPDLSNADHTEPTRHSCVHAEVRFTHPVTCFFTRNTKTASKSIKIEKSLQSTWFKIQYFSN